MTLSYIVRCCLVTSAALVRVALVLLTVVFAGAFNSSSRADERVPPPATSEPGEDDANRIESIYYESGPKQALEALRRDYASAFDDASSQQAMKQLEDEMARLKAHTAGHVQFNPLVALATEWCLETHDLSGFPLRYSFLLPPTAAGANAETADAALARDMISVLQINWITYANLTRSETRGYVADETQITIKSRSDLLRDQSEQEDLRLAINKMRNRS